MQPPRSDLCRVQTWWKQLTHKKPKPDERAQRIFPAKTSHLRLRGDPETALKASTSIKYWIILNWPQLESCAVGNLSALLLHVVLVHQPFDRFWLNVRIIERISKLVSCTLPSSLVVGSIPSKLKSSCSDRRFPNVINVRESGLRKTTRKNCVMLESLSYTLATQTIKYPNLSLPYANRRRKFNLFVWRSSFTRRSKINIRRVISKRSWKFGGDVTVAPVTVRFTYGNKLLPR